MTLDIESFGKKTRGKVLACTASNEFINASDLQMFMNFRQEVFKDFSNNPADYVACVAEESINTRKMISIFNKKIVDDPRVKNDDFLALSKAAIDLLNSFRIEVKDGAVYLVFSKEVKCDVYLNKARGFHTSLTGVVFAAGSEFQVTNLFGAYGGEHWSVSLKTNDCWIAIGPEPDTTGVKGDGTMKVYELINRRIVKADVSDVEQYNAALDVYKG